MGVASPQLPAKYPQLPAHIETLIWGIFVFLKPSVAQRKEVMHCVISENESMCLSS